MFFRDTQYSGRYFHVVVVFGGNIAAEEVVQGADKKGALRTAEQLVAKAEADGILDVTAYVLDHDQAFVASVPAPAFRYRDGA
jgi:hypothetical protein